MTRGIPEQLVLLNNLITSNLEKITDYNAQIALYEGSIEQFNLNIIFAQNAIATFNENITNLITDNELLSEIIVEIQ